MNDFRDLKAIAEACQQHQPLRFMRSHGALYIRNDNGIVFDVHQNRSFPEFMAQNKDYADLVLAANPETILALIAENQRLGLKADSLEFAKWSCQVNEQAIRAAGHETIEDLAEERDQLKAENDLLKSDNREMLKFKEHMVELRETHGFDSWAAALVEVDRLKAENEALRKGAGRYEWLRDKQTFIWLIQDWFPSDAEFTDVDAVIDAAMGQGERS
ncbi:hypothetical protein [Pseudomonas sp. BTN1]|uniref:hypothetical protein n=1 Tax=Pseudomonas sp. BTN1 TaxID=1750647 RepID=UPI00093D6E1A|nr:hypothetical protein [Pseudomonas sp. BTN1]OKO50341.1 hypothetical protein BMH52_01230 [Pseudomonas sp. BTN1]